MVKKLIYILLFIYPCIELTRLIIIYPNWNFLDHRPILELFMIWICFILAIYLSDKKIIKKYDKK